MSTEPQRRASATKTELLAQGFNLTLIKLIPISLLALLLILTFQPIREYGGILLVLAAALAAGWASYDLLTKFTSSN
ncbi:hypothetical protein [Haloarcula amylovorans]|uniref:hypothetical protein n=1 Tax=Haloarcula amylovorans TaxID=2562280 RepID=UPI0010762CE9|nr:hypothetical protein [Halomicroarcula amylolytica]